MKSGIATGFNVGCLIVLLSSCLPLKNASDVASGPGGQLNSDWNCLQLKEEFDLVKASLKEAIANFDRSFVALKDEFDAAKALPPAKDKSPKDSFADPSKGAFNLLDENLRIGEGEDALPPLPEILNRFKTKWLTVDGVKDENRAGRQVAQ